MRKLDIIKNLQSSTDLNRKEASEFFETFLNQLKKNIKNKNQKITRFGTFYKHITKLFFCLCFRIKSCRNSTSHKF